LRKPLKRVDLKNYLMIAWRSWINLSFTVANRKVRFSEAEIAAGVLSISWRRGGDRNAMYDADADFRHFHRKAEAQRSLWNSRIKLVFIIALILQLAFYLPLWLFVAVHARTGGGCKSYKMSGMCVNSQMELKCLLRLSKHSITCSFSAHH
jgi:hypothetical protein